MRSMNVSREIHVMDRLKYHNGKIRVMAIAQGWMMVRYKGCVPFTVMISDYEKAFPVDAATTNRNQNERHH